MATDDAARIWVEGYLRAWTSNDADDVRALFTDDAVYRDEPGTWGFAYDVLGEIDGRSVIRGVTTYSDGSYYDNVWFVTLVDGCASDFTEWFVEREVGKPGAVRGNGTRSP